MNTNKFDIKEAQFKFTTSNEIGHFNMYNENNIYLNCLDSQPEIIVRKFSEYLENTLKSMKFNKATTITMIWKWE